MGPYLTPPLSPAIEDTNTDDDGEYLGEDEPFEIVDLPSDQGINTFIPPPEISEIGSSASYSFQSIYAFSFRVNFGRCCR